METREVYGAFSRDVMSAILAYLNNEKSVGHLGLPN